MRLAHDKDGFLVGKPIESDRVNFAHALKIWRDIKAARRRFARP